MPGAADYVDVKPGIYEPGDRFARPQNEKEYNALPNGALFIDPDDGPNVIYKKGFGIWTQPPKTPSLLPTGVQA